MLRKILALVAMLYAVAAMGAVDANKANEAKLDGIKGIGPATSKMILAERKKSEFKDWGDFIARVKGLGSGRAKRLSKEGLTVAGQPYAETATGAVSVASRPY